MSKTKSRAVHQLRLLLCSSRCDLQDAHALTSVRGAFPNDPSGPAPARGAARAGVATSQAPRPPPQPACSPQHGRLCPLADPSPFALRADAGPRRAVLGRPHKPKRGSAAPARRGDAPGGWTPRCGGGLCGLGGGVCRGCRVRHEIVLAPSVLVESQIRFNLCYGSNYG